MAITVFPDGAIRVLCPEATPQAEVERRLRKRARWLIRQMLHFEQFRPRAPERRYVGGETHLYLGRQYRLKLHKRAGEEVKLKGGLLHVGSPEHRDARAVKRLVQNWYREKGRVRIADRFTIISARFVKMGCEPPAPIFRSMPRRWGSWSRNGRISLNPDLIRAPTACIDYVITHELIHLIHPHHGPAFYELLETLMPDWRSRKQRLERILA
ncbi:M48 family metallopeptidase [Bradyrhizobium sp. AUGA SZCCT0431]|uniref:M48 family metallopeptidase n=1 Tax=Bradyrhizobium sp. AUGA SZCCT0431 TaxID=2807674 RepID=UPI001BA740C3|nr:SprT family zinc-dependent metalloprotease [Bradyrhizobium sp. AUGA SZCCT0431]MBR1141723.1 M48 family metallopeptidase [Bradyrhizobium sp. AUGA SZCCT0431]